MHRGCFKSCPSCIAPGHCVNYWYWNFNRCNSEQQPLKTVGKTEFWNNFVILWSEFTFDLMGRSFIVIGTPFVNLNLDSPHTFMVKLRFQNDKNSHFVHRVSCSAQVDRGTGHIYILGWGERTATRTVLNHPLVHAVPVYGIIPNLLVSQDRFRC